MKRRLSRLGIALALLALAPAPAKPSKDPAVGKSYLVPYRLTDTNHFLVRVRVNGKGPFNFLVDSGAPALYVATETAEKIGLKPAKDDFWTPIDRLDFEGGASLTKIKARVEDPFQLVGMNALGLPGASIDGILGFTILARFRLEIDPTKDRMTWTRLDYEPKDPTVPEHRPGDKPPAEVQAMNLLGPLAKMAAFLTGGKQPEEQLHPRGFFGLELEEAAGEVRVTRVLPGTPAEKAGIRAGDRLVRLDGHDVTTLQKAARAISDSRPDARVPLLLKRGSESVEVTLIAGEGL
jgi:hypothetical protein